MDNGNPDHSDSSDTNPLDGTPLDRRGFLGLTAATGAALTLPESAAASSHINDPRVADLCQFVINNTPNDYETTVLVEFANNTTADWFDNNFEYSNPRPDDPEKTVIRKNPTPAGHGRLTSSEVSFLLTDNGVNSVEFSPGANPFWKLGGYDDGVFPDPIDSRDYLSHAEAIAGVSYLESEHPTRVRNTGIGKSPGWYDKVSGVDRQWDVHVTEVTNNIGDPSFADKQKVVYSLSIHGDERAGAEGGIRLIEDILAGEAPAIEQLLDNIVLIFLWTNPDGWVSREPWTEVGLQSHDRNFQRYTGGSYNGRIDPNRQYPTVGWTNPDFLPAEPSDAPLFFEDEVPDALAVVDHFRGYENVALFCDYHGMYSADHMMYYLESNASFGYAETHLVDELSRQTGQSMLRYWGGVGAIEDDIRDAAAIEYGTGFVPGGDQFNGLFDWGTIYDTIDYQVTGGMMGWAGAPERHGGLGAVAISPEIIISNNRSFAIQEWKPWWSRHYATAYQLSMTEYAKLAAVDTDATIATGDRDTAYVTTDELTRSSTDLPFTGPGPSDPGGSTTVRSDSVTVSADQEGVSISTDADAHSLSVRFEGPPLPNGGTARLVAPDGTVHETVSLGHHRGAGTPELFVVSPAAGEWTVEIEGAADVGVHSSVLASPGDYPDPRSAWRGDGFQQRFYEVNPMGFFDDLSGELVDGSLEEVGTGDVVAGALGTYDQLVVSHDVGTDNTDYVDAIESFVDGGGDLVLTDTGVHLLGKLDAVDTIDQSDVQDVTLQFGTLSNVDRTHPLLDGVHSRQQELYKGPQVGYTAGIDQPATVIDSTAFNQAGGETAGRMNGFDVGLGRLTVDGATIDCIGSILPPAQQEDVLHPFGMADHAVSMMGYSVLCNALKFEQRRFVAGELVRTTGPDWRGVENTIGNVDRNGDIEIVDAVRIQRQLAALDPGPFDPELADVNRDGEVSITDSVRIQRQLAGIDEPGALELRSSSVSVDSGTLTIQATVENVGDLGAIRETEFRLAESADDLDEYAVVALKQADPAGNSTKTVTASIETTALSPGTTYQYSVDCAGQQETGKIQIPSN
jgi:hypothetical protein